MPDLDQVLQCFPTVSTWNDAYLDDGRQRLLGDAGGFSVEIILGSSIDYIGIFSEAKEHPEMLAIMLLFLDGQNTADGLLDRSREYFSRAPYGTFHAILGSHTLTLFRMKTCTHFRISPSTDL